MDRRSFIKSAALLTSGSIAMPYILPSGRLFARTNSKLANHVILVMFAGGVRQQESVLQRYLSDSQNEDIPGNILRNLLTGELPENKIVFGTDGSRPGEIPIPRILPQPLQEIGTTFMEMRSPQVGHYGGLNVLVQGRDAATQGLKNKPVYPTIFEYLRKHGGYKSTDIWFVGSGIGNSLPLLNHSDHPDYGSIFGGNFIAPSKAFDNDGFEAFHDGKTYHPDEELPHIERMTDFLNLSFSGTSQPITSFSNSPGEQIEVSDFMHDMFEKTELRHHIQPPVRDNTDLQTVGYACEVMARFKPALTVVDLQNTDICHSNFTDYLRNLHRADHAVGFLWDYVQRNIPDMADDTIMIVVPECGRNLNPNPIRDENDWFAYDHSDENAHRIFGMMVGKSVPENLRIGGENNPVGWTEDIVPTIGHILGIKSPIMSAGYIRPGAQSLFDRI